MAPQPDHLFTPTNIISAGVASLAVNVVTNTFFRLLRFPPKWTAFITALVIAYLIVGIRTERHWYSWVLAFFNACLLFCSALGINETGVAIEQREGQGFVALKPWFKSWL